MSTPPGYPNFGPYSFTPAGIAGMKSVGGIYLIVNSKLQPVYAGQTNDLKRRLGEHYDDRKHCMWRYAPTNFYAEAVVGEAERLRREREMIRTLRPVCN